MVKQHKGQESGLLAWCPGEPAWTLDWEEITKRSRWIQVMKGIPQSPIYHAEGDVWTHTRMVVEALCGLSAWRALPGNDRALLFLSAVLHDVGKPACTQIAEDGQISSRGHARKGEQITRRLLWTGEDGGSTLPFAEREIVTRLVRWHGLPLQFLDKSDPERAVIEASQRVRMDHLALLAEADVRGRSCVDQDELLTRVELFRQLCREQQCYDRPRAFPTAHSRFVYFQRDHGDVHYTAYDDTTFEVVVLVGLPGVGKDTWIQEHRAGWPVIALDAIRRELHISAEQPQGRVVQEARERARAFMRRHQGFVWNATNVTKQLRGQLVDFFAGYGARICIVYLDAPFEVILKRNRERSASVPESVIEKLLDKVEVPDLTEAHAVEYWTSNADARERFTRI